MTLFEIVPPIAIAATVVAGVRIAAPRDRGPAGWLLPAVAGAAFLGWTVFAMLDGEVLGFWPLHTADAWGNQVWIDLLLAITVGWYLLQPRLRRQGIAPLPWFALIVATGSIGLLAVLARLLYAERGPSAAAQQNAQPHAQPHAASARETAR